MRRLLARWRALDTSTPLPPPRVIYEGFDWGATHKLVPTGAAALAKVVEARYQPRGENEHV